MKTLLHKQFCAKCGCRYDPALGHCPKCDEPCEFPLMAKGFAHMTPLGTAKEIVLFLTGWAGFQLIGTLLSLFIQLNTKATLIAAGLSGASYTAAMEAYLKTGAYYAAVNYPAYIILFCVMVNIVSGDLPRFKNLFKNGKTYLGFPIGVGLIFFSFLYNVFLLAIGYSNQNANQTAVYGMIDASPILAILCIGILGPFCEELAYRVGLFGFSRRINVYLAYAVASVLFGFIHMHFLSLSKTGGLIWVNDPEEWVTLPDYVVTGLVLAFTYEKLGFGASYLAHLTNNLWGVLIYLLSKAIPQ